jgi:3-phytase
MKKWTVLGLFCAYAGCVGCAATHPAVAPGGANPGAAAPVVLDWKSPPVIGTTPAGDRIELGGLSGLRYLGKTADGKLRFLSLTDRGPNADPVEAGGATKRPFLLPGFQPRILFLLGDPATGTITLEKQIFLKKPNGKPLSGLPQMAAQEHPVNSLGKDISFDPYGLDLETITLAGDGSFWAGDEYGPSVVRFSAAGKLKEILKPGSGLPKIFEQRFLNRGFEGSALLGNHLYVALQSPLDNPRGSRKKSKIVRIAEVDILGKRTLGQYAYVLTGGNKIGDLAIEGPRTLIAIEQKGKKFKRVFRIHLDNATNLQLLPERIVGPGGALESMSPEELAAAEIAPAGKEEMLDLAAAGVTEKKVEGIDLVDGGLAVAVDNDFGLSGEWSAATGKAGFKSQPSRIYYFPPGSWGP